MIYLKDSDGSPFTSKVACAITDSEDRLRLMIWNVIYNQGLNGITRATDNVMSGQPHPGNNISYISVGGTDTKLMTTSTGTGGTRTPQSTKVTGWLFGE